MKTSRAYLLALVMTAFLGDAVQADTYPVSGRWTYEDASAPGPAKDCRVGRLMDFQGERRFDTGTRVPDYRNVEIVKSGASLYRGVDEFFTGQIRGRVYYTLRLLDADHIEIELDAVLRAPRHLDARVAGRACRPSR